MVEPSRCHIDTVDETDIEEAGVDPKLRNEFAIAGYVGPIPIFTNEECRRIIRSLRKGPAIPQADWVKGNAVSSRLFFELSTYWPILDLVTRLIGPDVMLWGASIVRRPPEAVHPWHTDIETSAAELGKTVSVWIGLEHANQRSSLRLLSSSHRFGVTVQQAAFEKGKRRGEADDEEILQWALERDPGSRVVKPSLRNGDALFFDGRLWHSSTNKNLVFSRAALLLQYGSPDTSIQIPDPAFLEWPFRFVQSPNPACIMVKGTDRYSVNRTVSGPAPAGSDSLPLLSTWIQTLDLPLEEDKGSGWKPYPIFRGSTRQLTSLGCHVSVLSPGKTPHPPHEHMEEELLIMLSGEADLLIVNTTPSQTEKRHRLQPGSFVYYPAHQWHTIHNPGPQNATYLMFKWRSEQADSDSTLETTIVPFLTKGLSSSESGKNGFLARGVLNGNTRHLRKLHCHVTTLQPGSGYPPHVDAYDVAILTLRGTVETLGRQVGPNSVIFYAGGEPHGMENVGTSPAIYVVFEFHGSNSPLLGKKHPLFRRWLFLSKALGRLPQRLGRFVKRCLRQVPILGRFRQYTKRPHAEHRL